MKKSIGLLFACLLTAALVAGCSNSSNNNNNNGVGTNCGGPPNGFQMLYPRNGATKIGPSLQAIYVAANPALTTGNSYNFLPVTNNGTLPYSSQFATYNGGIPNPHNTPTPGSTVYVAQLLYPIGPLQTVQLYWNDGGTGCTPNFIVSTFSTTQ